MTVRTDEWPYYEKLGMTYRRALLKDVPPDMALFWRLRDTPIYKMTWDDFALFEPKPWKMQPGDLGLES